MRAEGLMAERDDGNDPWADLERIGERVPAAADALERFAARGRTAAWAPAADFMETGEAYVFEIELAGIRRGDIRLEIVGGRLEISGERRAGGESAGAAHHLVERPKGCFFRAFELPGAVDADRAFASFGDGLLTVTLPKKSSPGRIEIEVE
jgi:HSP20 family protein